MLRGSFTHVTTQDLIILIIYRKVNVRRVEREKNKRAPATHPPAQLINASNASMLSTPTPASPPSTFSTGAATTDLFVVACGVGVDPGLAKTGIGAVHRLSDGSLASGGVRFVQTARDGARAMRAGMDDTRRMREAWEVVDVTLRGLLASLPQGVPVVLGVEAYNVHPPRGVDELKGACDRLVGLGVPASREGFVARLADDRFARAWIEALGGVSSVLHDPSAWASAGLGQAAKTIGVWGVSIAAAFSLGVPVYVHTPLDLKRRACHRADASKGDVGAALESIVAGLGDDVARIPASHRNHVHDAVGHGLLALEALERFVGVRR